MTSIRARLTLLSLLVVLATVAASAATGGPVSGLLGLNTSEASAAKSKPCKKALAVVRKKCRKGNSSACRKARAAAKKKCKVKAGPPKVVGVHDDYYDPTDVSIKSGGSVKWVWDSMNLNPHDVVLVKGPKGTSISDFSTPGTYSINAKFQRTFTKPGTYNFHCTIHSSIMQMKVVVTN